MNRALIVLALLAVALGAYLFLVDLPGEESAEQALQQELRFFDFEVGEVDTLTLVRPDRRVVVARGEAGWRILEPITEPAQTGVVEDRLSQLAAARLVRVVRDSVPEGDWRSYGLADRRTGRKDVVVSLRDGDRQLLHVGNETPSGALVYVRRPDHSRLEVAERSILQLVWANVDGFREVDLFDVVDSTIVAVEVRGPHGAWRARRQEDGRWRRTDVDREVYLKRRPLAGLVHDIDTATIRGFEGRPEASEWAAYGLDPSWATLRWTDRSERQGRVDLGNDTGDRQIYARRDREPDLLLLLPQLGLHASVHPDSLVDRNPLATNFTRVDSVVVDYEAGGRQVVRRVGSEWHPVVDGELVTDDDGLSLAAGNLVRGLEEFQPQELWMIGPSQSPAGVLDRVPVRATIHGPDGEVRMGLGWKGRGEHHWVFLEGERQLHRVGRGLYLRFRGLGLRTGVLEP